MLQESAPTGIIPPVAAPAQLPNARTVRRKVCPPRWIRRSYPKTSQSALNYSLKTAFLLVPALLQPWRFGMRSETGRSLGEMQLDRSGPLRLDVTTAQPITLRSLFSDLLYLTRQAEFSSDIFTILTSLLSLHAGHAAHPGNDPKSVHAPLPFHCVGPSKSFSPHTSMLPSKSLTSPSILLLFLVSDHARRACFFYC